MSRRDDRVRVLTAFLDKHNTRVKLKDGTDARWPEAAHRSAAIWVAEGQDADAAYLLAIYQLALEVAVLVAEERGRKIEQMLNFEVDVEDDERPKKVLLN